MASKKITLPPSEMIMRPNGKMERRNVQTIEERNFQVALIIIESYFSQRPPTGVKLATMSRDAIRRTMDKSLISPQVRYVLALVYRSFTSHVIT
jgi:hypothetical protein